MNATSKVKATMPVSEVKAKLSEVVRLVEGGAEVTLTRNGKVVARLVGPEGQEKPPSIVGMGKGQVWMADDFDVLGPEWDEYMW